MKLKIKKCPWCGNNIIRPWLVSENFNLYTAMCSRCGTQSPSVVVNKQQELTRKITRVWNAQSKKRNV